MKQLMTQDEWRSLSAESRYRINLFMKKVLDESPELLTETELDFGNEHRPGEYQGLPNEELTDDKYP